MNEDGQEFIDNLEKKFDGKLITGRIAHGMHQALE